MQTNKSPFFFFTRTVDLPPPNFGRELRSETLPTAPLTCIDISEPSPYNGRVYGTPFVDSCPLLGSREHPITRATITKRASLTDCPKYYIHDIVIADCWHQEVGNTYHAVQCVKQSRNPIPISENISDKGYIRRRLALSLSVFGTGTTQPVSGEVGISDSEWVVRPLPPHLTTWTL